MGHLPSIQTSGKRIRGNGKAEGDEDLAMEEGTKWTRNERSDEELGEKRKEKDQNKRR